MAGKMDGEELYYELRDFAESLGLFINDHADEKLADAAKALATSTEEV